MTMKKTAAVLAWLFVIAVFTVLFRFTGFDVSVQESLYAGGCGWKYSDNIFVKSLYKYGTYPALIAGAWFAFLFIASFINSRFADKRRAAAFVILVFLVGPGLLVNVIFKSYGGRPRPRDIPQFCGMWEYRAPFAFGTPGRGHSFPCGHASVGFALGALYFVLRKKNKKAALTALYLSAAYGLALGFARMAQGGHFLSDVIFSAVFVYGSMHLLSARLKPDTDTPLEISRGAAMLFGFAIAAFAAAAFFLSVPYYKQKNIPISSKAALNAVLEKGSIRVPANPMPEIKLNVSGFGTPGLRYEERITDSGCALIIDADIRGFATELNAVFEANNGSNDASFIIKKGDIEFLRKVKGGTIDLVTIKGDIHFAPSEGSVIEKLILMSETGSVYVELPQDLALSEKYSIKIQAGSKVVFVNKSRELQALKAESAAASGAKELRVISKNGAEFHIKADKRAEFR